MTNIMLSTDEVMTLYRALQRALDAAAGEAKAAGVAANESREYLRIERLFEKVKALL